MLTPDDVRKLVFDAVAAGDESRLDRLCSEHQALILEHIAGWIDVPPEVAGRPEINEWYRNGLRAISRYCAEKLARYELAEGIARVLEERG